MTERSGMSRRQALMYGGLAAAVPLLPVMRPARKPGNGASGARPAAGGHASGGGNHFLPQRATTGTAELYWAWQQFVMPVGDDIGELYAGIASGMQEQGWAGVQQQQDDVIGYKPGIDLFAAIAFLYNGGQNFWQVIAVGGDDSADQAQQEIQQLQAIIANIKFL
jgi:hypothetical protein